MSQTSSDAQSLVRFRAFMVRKRFSRFTIKSYCIVARDFLRYLEKRSIAVDVVCTAEVERYLRERLKRYVQRNGHEPEDARDWHWHSMSPIKALLAYVQGQWPPANTIERELEWFKKKLAEADRKPSTIVNNLCVIRRFLNYLEKSATPVETVRRADVRRYVDWELRVYRKKHGRGPTRLVEWRCGLTPAVHAFLDLVHNERLRDTGWRLAPSTVARLVDYKAHLAQQGFDRRYVRDLCSHARHFLEYISERGLAIESVEITHVGEYLSLAARKNKKKHWYWMKEHRRSVWKLLRHVQGEWPSGSTPSPLLFRFKSYLEEQRFSRMHTIPKHMNAVREFLDYLRDQDIVPETSQPEDLQAFVKLKQEWYRRQYGHEPKDVNCWRIRYTAPVRRFMRMLDPQWPRPKEPVGEAERFQHEVCKRYMHWMRQVRGLAKATVVKDGNEARQFLSWLGDRANADTLRNLSIPEIDRYVFWRMPGLRRATRVDICICMRSFLRYLHADAWIDHDLSKLVSGPPVYAFSEIPRSFTEEQVQTLVKTARADRRPSGLRDYAILMLLATYGIRAGEVLRLRLEDIDWRENQLRIHRSKTGTETILPLVEPVGNALLKYLKRGRPKTHFREIFIRVRAPYEPLKHGALTSVIGYRLKQARIQVTGRRAAHAFRFARAASLLRASVPLKTIGDLLGHQSADSTGIYLRLAVDDLRAISLEVPGKPDVAMAR